jgi:acyl-CoA synthetase (AMP-forming)/AMP-acid ligase II
LITAGDDGDGVAATAPVDAPQLTVADVLDLSAAKFADRIGIVDGEQRCSYADLRDLALRAAAGFAELGVTKGDRVALWMPNGLDWAVAFFGAIYAGAVVVPLNTALSVAEIEYQVAHSGASVLVACVTYRNRDYLSEARQIRDRVSRGMPVVMTGAEAPGPDVISWTRLVQASADRTSLPSLVVSDPAIMLYTSGTTGRPKGAVHTHRFVASQFSAADHLKLTETDCLVLYLPLFHIYALVAGLVLMTLVGARLVLMARFDAAGSLRLIEDEHATVVYGIPTTYIDQLNDPAIDRTDFSALRFAFTPLAYDLCQKVADKFGTTCLNPYGMTETAALVMVAGLTDPPNLAMGTVGRPLAGMEVKVVDEATGVPVLSGSPGSLLMRGPSVMWKYHEQPDATAAALDTDQWLRTGDLASMDDAGNVTFIGRRGDSYRVGGEIVDPVEVEAALQSHPDVLRAAALGVPDERLGEVGYAWVQVRQGSALTDADLRAHVSGQLASFKVPREIRTARELPTTPSGKVQKYRLRETLASQGPTSPS